MNSQTNNNTLKIKSQTKILLKQLLQKPIAYNPINAKIMGSVAGGVLLSQLLYWYSELGKEEFWHKNEDLMKETGLSLWELKTSKKKLVELGICLIEQKSINEENRWYRVTFYKLNIEKYINLLIELENQKPKNNLPHDNKEADNTGSKNSTDLGVEILPPEEKEFYHSGGRNPTARVVGIQPPIENNREYIENIYSNNLLNNKKQKEKVPHLLKDKAFFCNDCQNLIPLSRKVITSPSEVICYDCYKKRREKLKSPPLREAKEYCGYCGQLKSINKIFLKDKDFFECYDCIEKKKKDIEKLKSEIGKSFFSSPQERAENDIKVAKEERMLKK